MPLLHRRDRVARREGQAGQVDSGGFRQRLKTQNPWNPRQAALQPILVAGYIGTDDVGKGKGLVL